jgi:hypothetical protein
MGAKLQRQQLIWISKSENDLIYSIQLRISWWRALATWHHQKREISMYDITAGPDSNSTTTRPITTEFHPAT